MMLRFLRKWSDNNKKDNGKELLFLLLQIFLTIDLVLTLTTNNYVIKHRQHHYHNTLLPYREGKTSLSAVHRIQDAYLDGAEWATVQEQQLNANNNDHEGRRRKSSIFGKMTIVIGTLEEDNNKKNDVIIGMKVNNNNSEEDNKVIKIGNDCYIYHDSYATLPSSDEERWDEIIMTYASSLSSIHCALPQPLKNIGGSSNVEFSSSEIDEKVVVVGGSKYACFVASGLSAMKAFKKVYLITTANQMTLNLKKNKNDIEILEPSIGEMEIGFASYIGNFDCLVDTIHDERTNMELNIDNESWQKSGVLTLLRSRHNCDKYLSAMTKSQRIIIDDGIFFGPNKIKNHITSQTKEDEVSMIVPPKNYGRTIQTLLDNDIMYSWKKNNENNILLRSWTLPEYWELALWPRDAEGSNIRFGFPIIEGLDTIAAELQALEEEEEEEEDEILNTTPSKNPFVSDIHGVNGLAQDIIEPKQTALLFLTASWCRTCKTLSPGYTRLARKFGTTDSSVKFLKADTSGAIGKELGRTLNVNAVPMFLFFKDGERYGTPLSGINKLPSTKLNTALELLRTGADANWKDDDE